MCGVFLWKGNIKSHPQARVAWSTVTKPKKEGGLDVIDLAQWNKATCLKLIWLLLFKAGSVWVAWYREEVLQGNLSNFWTAKPNRSNSWLANKLLKLRPLIFPWIKMRIGNGLTCRFWYDNWTPYGRLEDYYTYGANSRLGIPGQAVLTDLSRNGNCYLPHPMTDNQLQVVSCFTAITLQDQEDYYEWELNGKKVLLTPLVRSIAVYEDPRLRFHGRQQSGSHEVSLVTPSSLVSLCWNETLQDMQSLQGSKLIRRLTLLAWQSTMYAILTERNSRLHRNISWSTDSIVKEIDRQIINKISALRSTNPISSSTLMEEVLQGNLSNFWTAKPNRSNSWLANKLLKLRPLIFPWIKMRIGNGLTCRFWYDNWTPYGRLEDYYTYGANSRLGIPGQAVLADLSRNGNCYLPHPMTDNQLQVVSCITTITLQDQEVYYEWELNGKKVLLTPLVRSIAVYEDPRLRCWNETLQDMQSLQGSKLIRHLTLLAWQSTMYAIWTERNSRLHRNISWSTDSIVNEIDRQIINKISALRSTNPISSSTLM
ncbi:hypothetical protein F2Q68_00033921 [Brassica cretica]|uniref:Reverse transcriptase zinc-binding domain-containing protein n=1 Tax=Brassica cretica TaxID=69181 RepID=A0A8S9HAD9_BRACR|nr:hypothetical protein F2Q68_00033921 [Brassica cretica]